MMYDCSSRWNHMKSPGTCFFKRCTCRTSSELPDIVNESLFPDTMTNRCSSSNPYAYANPPFATCLCPDHITGAKGATQAASLVSRQSPEPPPRQLSHEPALPALQAALREGPEHRPQL